MVNRNEVRASMRRRGASTLEYALILALITGTLVVVLDVFGSTVKTVIGGKLSALGGAPVEAPQEAPLEIVVKGAPATAPALWQDEAAAQLRTPSTLLAIGLLVVLGVAWRANRARERTIEAEAEEHEEKQARFIGKRQTILRMLGDDLRPLLEDRLTVSNVMTRTISKVKPETTAVELRKLLEELEMHHLLVCDPDDALLGVLSDRDIYRKSGKTAAELMTAKPLTVTSETPLRTASSLMLDRRISCLPVVDRGQLTGIMTITDLVMTLQCSLLLVRSLFFEMSTDDHCLQILARAAGKNAAAAGSLRKRENWLGLAGLEDQEIAEARGAMSFEDDLAEST